MCSTTLPTDHRSGPSLNDPLPLVHAFELLHELALGLEQQLDELRTLGLGHLRVLRACEGAEREVGAPRATELPIRNDPAPDRGLLRRL